MHRMSTAEGRRLPLTFRPVQDTIPAVTLLCNVRGLPSARTHSPTRIPSLLPILTVGRASAASTLTSARSESLGHNRL